MQFSVAKKKAFCDLIDREIYSLFVGIFFYVTIAKVCIAYLSTSLDLRDMLVDIISYPVLFEL